MVYLFIQHYHKPSCLCRLTVIKVSLLKNQSLHHFPSSHWQHFWVSFIASTDIVPRLCSDHLYPFIGCEPNGLDCLCNWQPSKLYHRSLNLQIIIMLYSGGSHCISNVDHHHKVSDRYSHACWSGHACMQLSLYMIHDIQHCKHLHTLYMYVTSVNALAGGVVT